MACHRSVADSFGWHRDNFIGATAQVNTGMDNWAAFYAEQAAFYARLRAMDVFIHAPDDYFFSGGANKGVLGYAEMQFNLPRDEWIAISRQQVYDDTWIMAPTQGWTLAVAPTLTLANTLIHTLKAGCSLLSSITTEEEQPRRWSPCRGILRHGNGP